MGARDFLDRILPEVEREVEARVGPLAVIPTLAVTTGDLTTLQLNHRLAFVLSQIDGFVSFEDILDLSGMGRLETLRMFARLLRDGIIKR